MSNPVHFLLVDDLAENLLALEALLRREGLVSLKAQSGPEALELLLKHDVALALLDVQMPGMDGFELAELMRGTERTRMVPIIFVTAGTSDQQRRFRGYEAGAVDFLNKPIEPDMLKSKANVFFELYRQKQEISRLLEESRQYAEALKETDRRKDEFLATLAHELRNPLAPIRNGLNILQMRPDETKVQDVQAMMDRQLTHMVHLVDDLLDMSRVSQGKIDLHKMPVTLQSAVRSAIESATPLLEQKAHHFTYDIPKTEIWVLADFTRLAQIINNLLNNAAKYTPEGGKIHLTLAQENGQAVVSVSDNGIGLERSMLSRIFDLFAQVDSSLQRSEGGLGIGLALVKHLVEMHGGNIQAQSAGLGKGSNFVITLPLVAAESSATQGQSGLTKPASKSLRVLVVDDNQASTKTTGWMLEMIGHQPTLAFDGPEALEIARTMKPDVVLLDIGLPSMSGYDICRELRKEPSLARTIFIAQTGWGQKEDIEKARKAGFHHHLLKPIDLEHLTKLLSDL